MESALRFNRLANLFMPNHDKEFPLVFLSSWILQAILKRLRSQLNFVGPLVEKNFITASSIDGKVPILRISGFLKVTKDCSLSVILSDATSKVLALFPYHPTILNFEVAYKQRITYHTLKCLIGIRQAHLRFVSNDELKENFGFSQFGDTHVVVLEILDFFIFDRDQIYLGVNIEKKLNFIYWELEYQKECGSMMKTSLDTVKNVEEKIMDNYDDMISL